MSRRGEIAGQIFIYILALVIVSLIVIYGYKAVRDLHSKSGRVALIEFTTDIQNTLERMSTDYGSVMKKTMAVPSGFDAVCFIDTAEGPGDTQYRLVDDSWRSGAQANVFLVSKNTVEPIFAGDKDTGASYLSVDDEGEKFLCLESVNGRVEFAIRGMGNKAEVTRA